MNAYQVTFGYRGIFQSSFTRVVVAKSAPDAGRRAAKAKDNPRRVWLTDISRIERVAGDFVN